MLEALPGAGLPYPAEWYAWTASQVLPIRREAFASGRATGKWPVPNHPTVTGELGYINLIGVTLLDGDRLIRATNDADYFCWSVLQPDDSCPNPLMPISRYFIDGVEVHPDALEF